eukprot:2417079-Rhodomonas_salina.1
MAATRPRESERWSASRREVEAAGLEAQRQSWSVLHLSPRALGKPASGSHRKQAADGRARTLRLGPRTRKCARSLSLNMISAAT